MAIVGLNHYNIIASAERIEAVRSFYVDVIGLTEGFRPNFDFAGHWLYAGEAPVLHLMVDNDYQDTEQPHPNTGHLDHIAFSASELESMEAKLNDLGVVFKKKEVPGFNITQLFIHDPIGLGVELNFMAG